MRVTDAPGAGPPLGAAAGAVVAGMIVALQLQSNAQLGIALDSALAAAVVAFASGAVVLGVVLLATGRWRRAAAIGGRHGGDHPQPWWLLGGATGGLYVAAGAAAAPVLGLTLLTLSLVAGQLSGSIVTDALGLSPQGRMRAGRIRVLSAAVGVLGVAIASGGQAITGEVGAPGWPVALAVAVVGACSTLGVAANGRLGVRLGEPLVAAFISVLVALVFSLALASVALLASGSGIRSPWDAPPLAWSGGALGALWLTASIGLVRRLGVLVLLVGALTGQLLGAVALDVAAPLGERTVDLPRLAGVAAMAVAVVLASVGSRFRS